MDMRRIALMLLAVLLAGCGTAEKPKAHPAEQSEREQIESEVREGGLKDPGGAKSLRDEAAEQQREQQEQINEIDQ